MLIRQKKKKMTKSETGDVETKGFDIQKANQVRNLIQSNAVKMFQQNHRVLLTWATGCGKTLAALKMVASDTSAVNVALICKEHSHLSNWEVEIKKYAVGSKWLMDTADKFLYDS